MSHSKKLAVATTDRMISFYSLDGSTKKSSEPPKSRIEDLPAVPLCLEYVKHKQEGVDAKKTGDEKKPLETLLWGDDLGIITMYNFHRTDWHICKFKAFKKQDRNYLRCHETEIFNDYYWRQWNNEQLKETYQVWQSLPKLKLTKEGKMIETDDAGENESTEPEGMTAASSSGSAAGARPAKGKGKKKASNFEEQKNNNKMLSEEEKVQKRRAELENKRPTQYRGQEWGFTSLKVHAHWGWVTKIKYYEDLIMLLSSSLDGFIHMHELENLNYRQKRTFNLHQKGINSFVYSKKHKQVASCGEERHIILWEPYTLQQLAYLNGHNTSVSDLDINEERNHLISLGTDKVVKIWDTKCYECI